MDCGAMGFRVTADPSISLLFFLGFLVYLITSSESSIPFPLRMVHSIRPPVCLSVVKRKKESIRQLSSHNTQKIKINQSLPRSARIPNSILDLLIYSIYSISPLSTHSTPFHPSHIHTQPFSSPRLASNIKKEKRKNRYVS